jgi:DNA repair protein RecN (Recombination protein N)
VLKKLSVKNYALIDSLEMQFNSGFSVITGETGAGKSILLGALSLILGNRADSSALKNQEQKCIIEGHYDISAFGLQNFFEREALDYFDTTILRREISPQGRSRAFINDSPVNLNLLKELGDLLTDIHSQHHNLALRDHQFQLYALDAFAGLSDELTSYAAMYRSYKKSLNRLSELEKAAEAERTEQDYYQFRYDELEKADLKDGEQEALEEQNKLMEHAAEIKQTYGRVFQSLSGDDLSVAERLTDCIRALVEIENYLPEIKAYKERIKSSQIDLADIASDLETRAEDVEYSPEEAEAARNRLDTIYQLQKKHRAETVEELLKIQQDLQDKLENISTFDDNIKQLKAQIKQEKDKLEAAAEQISMKRRKAQRPLEKEISSLLQRLGMPNAVFSIQISKKEHLAESGKDDVAFLFSANKNNPPDEISKIASGGEISRLMLSLKAVIAGSVNLPTIIFDEIDTGISGDIADKTGSIMRQMSKSLQVIDITHLPQIAAKADTHYVVYKTDQNNATHTKVKQVIGDERTHEIAKMLSGENITDAAVKNAHALLQGI